MPKIEEKEEKKAGNAASKARRWLNKILPRRGKTMFNQGLLGSTASKIREKKEYRRKMMEKIGG